MAATAFNPETSLNIWISNNKWTLVSPFYNNIIFISTLILKITGMVIEICFQLIITLGDFEYSFHQQKHLNDIHFFFLVHSRLWTGVTGGVAVLGGGGL